LGECFQAAKSRWLGQHGTDVKAARARAAEVQQRCAVVDLPLFEGGRFVSNETISTVASQAVRAGAVLRVQGKLATDMAELNSKVG
jgi:hypothetical protein